ncbi:MAG: hypothetical protein ABW252_10275 [Polyangiales bacterium]
MATGLSGCGDDDGPAEVAGSSGTAAEQPSQFAVCSKVYGTDFSESTSLLWLVNQLEGGALPRQDAVELAGAVTMWGVPGSGEFYVVGAEALTVTKYRVQGSSLQAADRIGLAGAGLTALIGEQMVFVDTHRAFLFDPVSLQALELDLDAMHIVGTLPLPQLELEGAERTFFSAPGFTRHGDRFVAALYGTTLAYDRVTPASKLVFFDPATKAVEVKDAPCAGLGYSVAGLDGALHFATDPWVASLSMVSPATGAPSCMVRLPAGSTQPDAQTVSLDALTGGVTGGLIPGSNGTAYVRVLDRVLFRPSAQPSYNDAYSAEVWQTWKIDLSGRTPAIRVERAPMAGGIRAFDVGSAAYENASTANFASTTLVRTTGADAPRPGVSMPGVAWGLLKVR